MFRAALRNHAAAARRFASTSAASTEASAAASHAGKAASHAGSAAKTAAQEAAGAAKEVAGSNPQVQSAVDSAQRALNGAMETAKRVSGPVGERVGSMLGKYREPLIYNFRVATSLARQVYLAEKLAPPTQLSSWTTAYAKLWSRATSAGWYRQIMANGEWVKIGIYGLEAYGIFKIGEIIGRRNLVGYKLKE